TRSRTLREKNQYALHVAIPHAARRSPNGLQLGRPDDAIATTTTPRNDRATSAQSRGVTRSWSRRADRITIATGAIAPITATSAIVVCLIAVNDRRMSAAKMPPPSAHNRNTAHDPRRPVSSIATPDIAAPAQSRNIAKWSASRPLHLTST